ncbi:hypothetical protein COCVIDRAFT_15527 [Bipolaris victoriae FI3]|uniref:C3H1-type domain-containing protein n=1 Tax=Bipolaris victoriae (strain FI3) TaxID=930091 RepID=W7EAW7_BIPV3|nr:hypothetical protein COCVIDRAFT_15527 [Bipolaris victoriae FI3]
MATQHQNICPLPGDLRFYLLRGNTMVPLIPADQLPFQLKGIPRQLTHRQMSDQGWKLFKETKDALSMLSVQAPISNDGPSHCSPDGKPQYLAPDHNVRTESQNTNTALSHPGRLSPQSPALDTYENLGTPSTTGVERQSSLADAVASVYHREAQRSGYNNANPGPEPSKKVYCTHWIATGECRWMHTGCKYKHEMPGTEKLRELGFTRGTPRWWRERNAVSPAKPLTWMQRKVGGGASSDGLEPPAENMPPPARSFPEPLPFRTRRLQDRYASSGEIHKIGGVSKRPEHSTAKSTIVVLPPTPNLIDLDDTPVISPPSPSQSQTSTAESSETRSPLSCASYFTPPTSPGLPRKSPLTKPLRRKIGLVSSSSSSSSSSPSSSSPSSSSQEDGSDTETETDTDDVPAAPVTATTHRQRRSKRDASALNAMSAARRVTGNEPKLGLASSKYAVKMSGVQRQCE